MNIQANFGFLAWLKTEISLLSTPL